MTFTLSWIDPAGLHERGLGLSELVAIKPRLEAPATVVSARGEVCGQIHEHLSDEPRRQQWNWYLDLAVSH